MTAVHTTKVIEVANCTTTNVSLKLEEVLDSAPLLDRNICPGWKPDRNIAGYEPAPKPINKPKPNNAKTNFTSLNKLSSSCLPKAWLYKGNNNSTNAKAKTKEINTNIIASPKNCMATCPRLAPSTLRMATSLARWLTLAVDKFIKLIQAINKINAATILKVIISVLSPIGVKSPIFPASFRALRWRSSKDINLCRM